MGGSLVITHVVTCSWQVTGWRGLMTQDSWGSWEKTQWMRSLWASKKSLHCSAGWGVIHSRKGQAEGKEWDPLRPPRPLGFYANHWFWVEYKSIRGINCCHKSWHNMLLLCSALNRTAMISEHNEKKKQANHETVLLWRKGKKASERFQYRELSHFFSSTFYLKTPNNLQV